MFVALFTTAKTRKRPRCPSMGKEVGYAFGGLSRSNKTLGRDLAICNDLEESREHYA